MTHLLPSIHAADADRLLAHVDVERKLVRALETLGPIVGRDVLTVGSRTSGLVAALAEAGARISVAGSDRFPAWAADLVDGSADVIVGLHSAFRGIDEAEQSETDRILRPGGRLLVVHDYGRDDVGTLLPDDLPEFTSWSRRGGPFFAAGFRVRVIHCWWTFESIEEAHDVLAEVFGDRGAALAGRLKRPRLSYNVAVYHRDRREPGSDAADQPEGREGR